MAKRIYNQTALFGPLYAYLAVISPPAETVAELSALKLKLAGLGKSNLQSTPHITLFERLTDDPDLAETVGKLLADQQSFEVCVEGFTVFDHTRYNSIVLPVTNPEPILEINTLLKGSTKTPFLTFARWLSAADTAVYIDQLSAQKISACWECSEVLILRKLMSEKHLGFKEKTTIKLKKTC